MRTSGDDGLLLPTYGAESGVNLRSAIVRTMRGQTQRRGALPRPRGDNEQVKKYTTAEAFALVASGEREQMLADSNKETCDEKIERNQQDDMIYLYDRTGGAETWEPVTHVTDRADYYDPNEKEEPATAPQYRPCSKAFALRHPEESWARYRNDRDSRAKWTDWHRITEGDGAEHPSYLLNEYQTTAPPEPGHICEIQAGVAGIEVVTTDDRGRVKTSGTVRVSGGAGRVVFVEDEP